MNVLIDHLVSLCEELHFDGWLINIENSIDVNFLCFQLIIWRFNLAKSNRYSSLILKQVEISLERNDRRTVSVDLVRFNMRQRKIRLAK